MVARYRLLLLLFFLLCGSALPSFCQQDVDFHLSNHYLAGKVILKVKRDFNDAFVWVLAKNNEVYRINNATQSVDNFTATFAAYNSDPLIDIAGLSQDTVFVATQKSVIEFKKNKFKTISAVDGLADTVTSIGIGTSYFFSVQGLPLFIGTTKGFGVYDYQSEILNYIVDPHFPRLTTIFETTYRNFMMTNPFPDRYTPTLPYYPVIFRAGLSLYSYDILNVVNTNNRINTAFYTLFGPPEISSIYAGSFFWGNENGLYQENINTYPGFFPTSFQQYLNNIKVNKITDIIGLNSLYTAKTAHPLTKGTLLVGTDNGLYFSSSVFDTLKNNMAGFSLFHYDELGNIPVNDVCVNATYQQITYYTTGCEDGVWLATNDGVYLTKPDYGKYIGQQKISNGVTFDIPAFPGTVIGETQICQGDSMKIFLNRSLTGNTIQWTKNGNSILGAHGYQLTVKDSGNYSVVLYSPCEGISVQTNVLKLDVIAGPTFTFNYPSKIQYCDSASTTLSVTGSPIYNYRWYKNGVLNGANTASFKVTQSGKYKVEVSACSNTWFPSKEVQVDLINLPLPLITTSKAIYCAGDTASLQANIPIDTTNTISWYRDGNQLPAFINQTRIKTTTPGNYTVMLTSKIAGCTKTSANMAVYFTPAPVFTLNYADTLNYCDGSPVKLQAQAGMVYNYRWYKDGILTRTTNAAINITQTGNYRVEASACAGSWLSSKTVRVNFIKLPVPVILTDKALYCIGDNATLNLSIIPNPGYTISWYKDGTWLAAQQNLATLTTNIPGDYMVKVNSTIINCQQVSAIQHLFFNPQPVVSIQKIIKTTLCDGQTIDLKANYTGGTVKWSTGETAAQITVSKSGTYRATVTSAAGCVADTSISIQFSPLPVLHINDTLICTFTKQIVVLKAPLGYSQYSWNNGLGNKPTYPVSTPQTVSLTVTDANGCQATTQVTVSAQCPDILLANAFSPNGDGINDTWEISGLENDASATVKVFTRNGQTVFESMGYAIPWDGIYKGKKLPTGPYYYIITAKGGKQVLSGTLAIVY
jgi:gliding motility-associated-like protein